MRRTAALIAGGGPAGAAAAILLARGGAMPVLVERHRTPQDVVCGGFLGGDAIDLLRKLGLDPAMLGARPIRRVRLIAGDQIAEADLPFAAAGLSRRTLDGALLGQAEAMGAMVERGIAIRRIEPETGCLHLDDAAVIATDALFLATGKHETRGVQRPVQAVADPALGLRTRLDPSPALAGALEGVIELHLFDRGYAGLLVQEDGGINLCLSIAQSRLAQAGGQPAQLIESLAAEAPRLADRFAAARTAGPWASIARVPYGWRMRDGAPGLFRLGDQAAVIPSLAGDGVAIALASGIRAAHCFLEGGPGAATTFQPAFARMARRPLRLASVLRAIGRNPWAAGPLVMVLRQAPGLIRQFSAMTRISESYRQ